MKNIQENIKSSRQKFITKIYNKLDTELSKIYNLVSTDETGLDNILKDILKIIIFHPHKQGFEKSIITEIDNFIFDDQLGLNKQRFCYVENLFSLDVYPVSHIIYSMLCQYTYCIYYMY